MPGCTRWSIHASASSSAAVVSGGASSRGRSSISARVAGLSSSGGSRRSRRTKSSGAAARARKARLGEARGGGGRGRGGGAWAGRGRGRGGSLTGARGGRRALERLLLGRAATSIACQQPIASSWKTNECCSSAARRPRSQPRPARRAVEVVRERVVAQAERRGAEGEGAAVELARGDGALRSGAPSCSACHSGSHGVVVGLRRLEARREPSGAKPSCSAYVRIHSPCGQPHTLGASASAAAVSPDSSAKSRGTARRLLARLRPAPARRHAGASPVVERCRRSSCTEPTAARASPPGRRAPRRRPRPRPAPAERRAARRRGGWAAWRAEGGQRAAGGGGGGHPDGLLAVEGGGERIHAGGGRGQRGVLERLELLRRRVPQRRAATRTPPPAAAPAPRPRRPRRTQRRRRCPPCARRRRAARSRASTCAPPAAPAASSRPARPPCTAGNHAATGASPATALRSASTRTCSRAVARWRVASASPAAPSAASGAHLHHAIERPPKTSTPPAPSWHGRRGEHQRRRLLRSLTLAALHALHVREGDVACRHDMVAPPRPASRAPMPSDRGKCAWP